MMKRSLLGLCAVVALAACQPTIPESGRGVGFDTQAQKDRRVRDAALANANTAGQAPVSGQPAVAAPPPVAGQPLGQPLGAPLDGSAQATAAQTTAVLDATRPGGVGNDAATNSGQVPLNASPSNPAPTVVNTAGISAENDFNAVSGQRSIDADAARIANNAANYEVVQPQALPSRQSDGPNIVAYALQNQHPVGQSVYARGILSSQARAARSCARYASADLAQIDFLSKGGPQRDRSGLDPDGDGYACDWDPTPFRSASTSGG